MKTKGRVAPKFLQEKSQTEELCSDLGGQY